MSKIHNIGAWKGNVSKVTESIKNVIVSFDLPTSHQLMQNSDEFTNRMLSAINDLMLDLLAAVARKDYQDRRRRQKEGITKALSNGLYKGRRENSV
ncbi:hypothetical protein HWV03_04525 [Moritella sp. 36]|uniref:hypothetical protein n=1 Tax=Moritella sp. 36 TaxID=2746233 RepID=UPI001BADEF26|nr:hypothetical protein [Moritella sp. 36]QUM88141.1 hypothetical protein HWV03_04525 [Moritella sp. 36]